MYGLRELQDGFRLAMVGGDPAGLEAFIAGDGLEPAARLSIYRHHVFTTLTDALAATYPVVCRLVDRRFFAYAADRYIRQDPPTRPCLFEYGETFPSFLAEFPPCRDLAYLPDVARMEWAINRALHADDADPIDPTALASVSAIARARLRFRLHPSVGLIESPWPIDRIWRANQPEPDAAATVDLDTGGVRLEVRRLGDDVIYRPLDPGAWGFRRALAGGTPLADAARVAVSADPGFDLAQALYELLLEGALVGFDLSTEIKETDS